MLRSKAPASTLQKIYEEGYLKCSTAVYYEGQGNEAEAMRCWKSAAEQIRHQCSETELPDYATLSETDKALANSLRELEYQAQERIDLLEALRISRREDPFIQDSASGPSSSAGQGAGSDSPAAGDGWIGDGTIPAITYAELSRPTPPLPPRRPVANSQPSNERAQSYETLPIMKKSSSNSSSSRKASDSPAEAHPDTGADASPSGNHGLSKRSSRSPGREKQHMLRPTLRTGKSSEHRSKSSRSSTSKPTAERLGASKAATIAWSALGLSSGKADSSRTAAAVEPPHAETSSSTVFGQSWKQRDEAPYTSQVPLQWDSNSRRLVPQKPAIDPVPASASRASFDSATAELRYSGEYATPHRPSSLSLNAAASALSRTLQSESPRSRRSSSHQRPLAPPTSPPPSLDKTGSTPHLEYFSGKPKVAGNSRSGTSGTPKSNTSGTRMEIRRNAHSSNSINNNAGRMPVTSVSPVERHSTSTPTGVAKKRARGKEKETAQARSEVSHILADEQSEPSSSEDSDKQNDGERPDKEDEMDGTKMSWKRRKQYVLKHLPPGVDDEAAKHIINEIVVHGDVVHWNDIAGLDPAKKALREVVVYPFLRPDLFMGLREPATGMLLFGPPGTGKTMLARAVATESKSTFFSISASSLTSKYLGESEKLVRALFALAKTLAPSIIFVDEIDSILSQRSGTGEHEATRRIKTEFLIQWSDLQRAAAGREDKDTDKDGRSGDANRVLVLAATNLPWAIDEAARRRFARRQYIPLPEANTRAEQLRTLLGQQKHNLTEDDIQTLVKLTDGFSGSDITALAKDAAMGPLRSLGEALLMTKMDEIRPMELADFVSSLHTIRPSVSKAGLKEYEGWAKEFGERGG